MGNLKIDKEFEKIIPALDNSKQIILTKANDKYIEIITIKPHEQNGYCYISRINSEEMIETYTRRGININYINVFLKDINLFEYNVDIKKYVKSIYNKLNEKTNVYIAQSVIGGPIKIGKSYNIDERLKQIQSMSPFKIKIIKVFENVSNNFETYLHDKYECERLHGEWFDEVILEDVLNEYENN